MRRLLLAFLLLVQLTPLLLAADILEVGLGVPRTVYTTAEPIELAILYKNDGGNLTKLSLDLKHDDGSILAYQVPFDVGAGKGQTRIVTVRAGALKPGRYTASAGGGDKSTSFSVHPGEPITPYWIAQWVHQGESRETTLAKGGWMFMTSDLATLHPRKPKPGDIAEWYVEARMRPYARIILGGGHQLDLDLENDWGDPWVQRTIVQRMQLAALSNRIYPIAGLHCYDEPGLTWWPIKEKDGKQIDLNPFAIPHHLDEFEKLTKKKMPTGTFAETGPKYAGMMDDWLSFADMRMKYLEQAWHATVWGTESVEPRFTTLNQPSSSYAPGTTTDGVDSRQNRPYKVVSGHGGYSDLPFGTMQPVRSAEGFQGFTRDRPHYFLPMWYTHTWASIRNAVWMSWTTKLDGMMYTPEQDFSLTGTLHGYDGTHTVFEIAEINRRLAMVGEALRHLPKTPAPVAVLHSHRQFAHDIATLNSPELHKVGSPQYASPHRAAVDSCFFRVMEQGFAPNWIDEAEAVEGGAAFLNRWKVIMCPRLATATPAFQKVLEEYAAGGGKLIQFKGDKLLIKGSVVAEHGFGDPTRYYAEKCEKDGGVLSPHYRDLAWRKWNNDLAPTFANDLASWTGPREYECTNKDILLGVHLARGNRDRGVYLLFANNAQSRENPRGLKHQLVPAETEVRLPPGGVVYDLLNGGEVPVKDGRATLRLAAGDGACWLRLGEPAPRLDAGVGGGEPGLSVYVRGGQASVPFRVRLIDPAGNVTSEQFRAAYDPGNGAVGWNGTVPMGKNAASGKWTLEVDEWLTGRRAGAAEVRKEPGPAAGGEDVVLDPSAVTVHWADARRIVDLFAAKPVAPPYDKLNWDAKRVFGLDPRKFAVFGPDEPAKKVADALKARGMSVEVNPKYEVKPFQREPGRGGAGVSHGVNSSLENIAAHAVVLPGHPLLQRSLDRGHITRDVTPTFPGPGRAYVQWGVSCYQPCWQNVFVLGDVDAGVAWLLGAVAGTPPAAEPLSLTPEVKIVPAKKGDHLQKFTVAPELKFYDTPVGVGSSPDGKATYVLLHDGSVAAHDRDGKELWKTQALLEGCALAVSPRGDRVAVAGYPGLLILDAASGKVLGGHKAPPVEKSTSFAANRMVAAAWSDNGKFVAAGWLNPDPKALSDAVVLDADGKELSRPKIGGSVMGVSFVPGKDVVLFGADELTAVKAANGEVVWKAAVKGAQSFAFSPDGKSVVAGGWGRAVGVVNLDHGVVGKSATFESVVGRVALLPDGTPVVALWGGTRPLMKMTADPIKPEPFFTSRFGFQSVVWSDKHQGLIAAEQGGRLWLLDKDSKPRAVLDDAGTTAYRVTTAGDEFLLGRMNRVVQHVALAAPK